MSRAPTAHWRVAGGPPLRRRCPRFPPRLTCTRWWSTHVCRLHAGSAFRGRQRHLEDAPEGPRVADLREPARAPRWHVRPPQPRGRRCTLAELQGRGPLGGLCVRARAGEGSTLIDPMMGGSPCCRCNGPRPVHGHRVQHVAWQPAGGCARKLGTSPPAARARQPMWRRASLSCMWPTRGLRSEVQPWQGRGRLAASRLCTACGEIARGALA